jgi:putative ABC transport system permease protein
MTNGPAALAALRIARRDAWRHKARSSLVVLMIALPVLGLTSADVLARTYQLSPTEKLDRSIGQADAALLILGGGRVEQGLTMDDGIQTTSKPHEAAAPPQGSPAYRALERRALALLPAGSRVIDDIGAQGQVTAGGRVVSASLSSLNLADPLTRGITDLRSGRFPSTTSEVVVTAPLAARLGLHIGSTVTVAGRGLTVTGLVVSPSALKELGVIGMPGSLPTKGGTYTQLVATHLPVTWPMVQRLNRLGVAATSRYVVAHPPAVVPQIGGRIGEDPATIGLATVAIGLAVLEVVLLAGAAFAVGARRARRYLALVSATGGQPGDVRNIVLAGGLVLGTAGAVIGVVGGVATARGLIPVLNHFAHHAPGSFDVRPLELLAVVVLGIVTGLIASVLPARAAGKVDVVAALTGRRGVVTTARRVPVIGLSGVVVGALIAGYGAHPPVRFTAILVGAVISELGFVMCAPAFVGLAGRLAKWAPLSPRLALRDAARHRGRSGPAVAAIMAAIAGSIAVSTYFVSSDATNRAGYQPQARIGQTVLRADTPHAAAAPEFQAALASVPSILGATGTLPVPTSDCFTSSRCSSAAVGWPDVASSQPSTVAVGGSALLATLAGRPDPAGAHALASGSVVALDSSRTGDMATATGAGGRPSLQVDGDSRLRLPVYVEGVGRAGSLVGAVISPATARSLGVSVVTTDFLTRTSRTPSQAQQDKAQAALGSLGATVYVERGYVSSGITAGLLVLLAVSAVVTLGATGITTGLSVAESRPDLTTLSAVGAAPLTRRLVVASQSATVALLGAVLGVLSGLIPAWAVVEGRTGMTFALPWQTIGLSIAAIPLLAVLITSAFVRTPSTLVRRAS